VTVADLLSNVVANLVGTFVGAGLALLIAWGVARRERRALEIQRLQRMIDRLYRSRALRSIPERPRRSIPLNTAEEVDLDRTTASILTTRSLIDEAANTFEAGSKSIPVLEDMYAATLDYLNSIEDDRRDYNNSLMRLRKALIAAEERLLELHPSLTLREPGGIEHGDWKTPR
jgi:septation ring formation regulator EzrA